MTKEECITKACQILRKRVRYDGADLRLPTTAFPASDTSAICAATRLYVESWIVPLLDCIESGDMTLINTYYEWESGHEMAEKSKLMSEEANRMPFEARMLKLKERFEGRVKLCAELENTAVEETRWHDAATYKSHAMIWQRAANMVMEEL